MVNVVISGGDSFTFGSEIPGDNPLAPHPKSWANLLSNHLGAEKHINLGRGGRSNSYIARHVIHTVWKEMKRNKPEDIFVQVMWSNSNRHEFPLSQDFDMYDSPWYAIGPFSGSDETKAPWFKKLSKNTHNYQSAKENLLEVYDRDKKLGIPEFMRQFVTVVQGRRLYDSYTTASEVVKLQNFLKLYNINYFFTHITTHAWSGIFYNSHSDPGNMYLTTMRDQIDKDRWIDWGKMNEGFDDWARAIGVDYGTSHPLEDGHRRGAMFLFNELRERKLVR